MPADLEKCPNCKHPSFSCINKEKDTWSCENCGYTEQPKGVVAKTK